MAEMEILRAARPYEDVFLDDPADNPDARRFRVWFDDENVELLLAKVADAIDRAQSINSAIDAAENREQRAEAVKTMAKLEKRVIVAFIGVDGWVALLDWMGGREAVDPEECTIALGEVMAQLLMMLGRKATSEQLRRCGLYYSQENAMTKALMQAQRADAPKAAQGGKKRRK